MFFAGLAVLLVVLFVSVAIHEASHMVAAKSLGMDVPTYSVGFGKTIFSKKWKSTDYKIKMLPIGGYVSIQPGKSKQVDSRYSEKDDKDLESNLLSLTHPFKRILVFLAGPLSNLILGFLALCIGFLLIAWPIPTTVVKSVVPCDNSSSCGAASSGIRSGDRILEVNRKPIESGEEVSKELKNSGDSVSVLVERNSEKLRMDVPVKNGTIGIVRSTETKRYSLSESVKKSYDSVSQSVASILTIPTRVFYTVQSIFTEERNPDSLASLLTMGNMYGTVADSESEGSSKIGKLVYLSGGLNIALFAVNLFPVIPLDGGRILIAFIDWIKMGFAKIRKMRYNPVSNKVIGAFATVGVSFVFVTMLSAIILDIVNPYKLG